MLVARAQLLLTAAVVLGLAIAVVFRVVFIYVGRLWLQARMSGVQITVLDLLGMRFRKTDVVRVVRALIMLRQAGATVSPREVERAYLMGVDLEKVTLAMIQAKKESIAITFQELVDAEMEDRLQEKLSGGERTG